MKQIGQTCSFEYEHKFNVHSNDGNALVDRSFIRCMAFGQSGTCNQTSSATINQLASNLTQANSELPIRQQVKAEILIPIFYSNGTNVESEK